MVSRVEFNKSSPQARIALLKKSGEYIGRRYYRGYVVRLYSVGIFYAELWIRMDFDQVSWIELADSNYVAEHYTGAVDLSSLGY